MKIKETTTKCKRQNVRNFSLPNSKFIAKGITPKKKLGISDGWLMIIQTP